MQGERSTFEPLCEAFEFDRPSGSSNPVMPQQMLWNDLPVSVDNPDIPSNPLSSSENISCANVSSQENASLNIWDLDGSSSSMPPLNQGSDDEMKLETGWVSSAVGNRVAGLRIVGGRPEVTSTLSFGNENTDLNNNSANNGENSSSEYLDFNALPHSTGYNTEHVGVSSRVHDSELHFGLPNPVLTRRIPISSPGSSLGGNSSKAIDFFSNNVRIRQEVAPCSSGKRKSIERVCGECSSGGNSIDLSDGVNHAEEEISMRISTIPAGEASDHHLFSGTAANGESFLRSTRMRISHADPTNSFTSDLWSQDNNVTRYNPWTTQPSPSSAALPSNQLVDFRVLDNNLGSRRQRHLRTIPVFSSDMYPFPQSGISTTEVGSSSGSPAVAVDGAELNSLAIPTTIPDQVFAPPDNTRNMVHDQTNWGSTSGSLVLPGNAVPASQVVANLGPYQSPGANWLTHQHRRRLSEAVRRSFFSAGSEARARSTSLPPRHNNSSTSQEVGRHHSGAASRLHQHPYMRLNMLHRQNYGALGISSTSRTLAAAREGRSRMTEDCKTGLASPLDQYGTSELGSNGYFERSFRCHRCQRKLRCRPPPLSATFYTHRRNRLVPDRFYDHCSFIMFLNSSDEGIIYCLRMFYYSSSRHLLGVPISRTGTEICVWMLIICLMRNYWLWENESVMSTPDSPRKKSLTVCSYRSLPLLAQNHQRKLSHAASVGKSTCKERNWVVWIAAMISTQPASENGW